MKNRCRAHKAKGKKARKKKGEKSKEKIYRKQG